MKKNYAVIAFSLLFFITIISGASYAGNRKGAFTLHPHIGGYVFEGNQDINSGPVFGVGLGYNVTERIGLEGVFNYVDTDASSRDRKPDVEAYLYRLDFLYHFMPDGELVPYLSAGVGAINVETDVGDNDDDTNMMVDGGAGVKVFIKDYLALRGEVRYVRDVEDDFNNFMYTIGLNFMFGGIEKVE